ncbi:MAG: energy transducer TonB [Gammaproteobacteria bacterium]|nr:MAG: energy transducer TonB [Gammaproteobacteria bacterium]
MQNVAHTPPVTANDRLGMTLFFAIFFHGIVILGITFISSPSAEEKIPPSLDVILVNTSTPNKPQDAEYLAQLSQDGGGTSDKKVRPTDVFTAATLSSQPGIALEQSQTQTPRVKQDLQQALLTQQSSSHKINTQKKSQTDDTEQVVTETRQENKLAARLAQELSLEFQEYSQKPKEKFINARTKEYVAASYMRDWVDRVERLGNADYPDEAIRKKLSGTLILDVVINADGTLRALDLRKSSGHQILDDAAKRIVKMASPFSPFPAQLQQQADVIHITRSWEFLSSNELRSY